ncbi:Hfq-related RNA-binding protein [Anabaena sp. CCY 0017]|uniref:Hfq-related RNA-binding protein n=1 Tax=Anabaena sp. CCY 0017 TaxID=3103866 RepID=UPI0039C630F0
MPTIEFDTSLPSIRQLQELIKQKTVIELKLVTGDLLTGKVSWQDQNCVCLVDDHNRQITIWKQAIAYYTSLSNPETQMRSIASVQASQE